MNDFETLYINELPICQFWKLKKKRSRKYEGGFQTYIEEFKNLLLKQN